MKREITILGTLFLALGWVGCLPDQAIDFYPQNLASRVPVHTMITIDFGVSAQVDASLIHKNMFQLYACQDEDVSTETSSTTKNSQEKQSKENKKDSQDSDTEKDTVKTQTAHSFLFYKQAFIEEDDQGQPLGEMVRVYLMPQAHANATTALKPATTYCVATKPLNNKNKKVLQGQKISFTTEEVPSFLYHEQISLGEFIQTQIRSTQDFLLLDFFEQSVSGQKLLSSITVCERNEVKQPQSGACKDIGPEISFELFALENIIRQDPYVSAISQGHLYGLWPKKFSSDAQSMVVVFDQNLTLDGSLNAEHKAYEVELLKEKGPPVGTALLKEINQKNENVSFKPFKIGRR